LKSAFKFYGILKVRAGGQSTPGFLDFGTVPLRVETRTQSHFALLTTKGCARL